MAGLPCLRESGADCSRLRACGCFSGHIRGVSILVQQSRHESKRADPDLTRSHKKEALLDRNRHGWLFVSLDSAACACARATGFQTRPSAWQF